MRHAYRIVLACGLACMLLFSAGQAASDEVKVILYNGKSVQGELVEENADYVIVLTDLGQIRTRRSAIESILYLHRAEMRPSGSAADSLDQQFLNDLVIVHLTNGETTNGTLLSKSLDSILLKSEWGRLTIPKTQVRLIEYISSEFAERGEPVTARLTAGNVLQGYIYHEDRNSVTLETSIGRLTLDKKQLRSLEYHTAIKPTKSSKPARSTVEAREAAAPAISSLSAKAAKSERSFDVRKRQDSFFLGYAPEFGENYQNGVVLGYCNRYLLKSFESFSLHASAQLSMAFFSLNKDLATVADVPGSMTAEGGAMVTTLSLGTPIHFFPTENPSYVFFLRPALEPHLVYKTLKKSYPSFPQQNSEEKSTKFRFGLGTEVGLEWTVNPKWSVGFSFGMHYISGEDDFNSFNITVGTQLY
jgi:sRNA-binding regulator protein Hfq